jgi:Rrf2 family protein
MIHLAGLPPESRASRAERAVAAECPEQFLSKVLQNLTRAGLVLSHRGNTGGFELPNHHRAATLLEIVEAIEGPMRLNVCLGSDRTCAQQDWCHHVWPNAQSAVAQVWRKATIADLAQRAAVRQADLLTTLQ